MALSLQLCLEGQHPRVAFDVGVLQAMVAGNGPLYADVHSYSSQNININVHKKIWSIWCYFNGQNMCFSFKKTKNFWTGV